MKLNKPLPLDSNQIKLAINETFDTWSQGNRPYALYYKGKMLLISKARVYHNSGVAKSQLFRMFKNYLYLNGVSHYDFDKQEVKDYLNELLNNGTIEIRQL